MSTDYMAETTKANKEQSTYNEDDWEDYWEDDWSEVE